MIAILDYGVGNLFSLESSFHAIQAQTVVTSDAEVLRQADQLVLPGVGAFEDAILKLRRSGLDRVLLDEVEKGKPLLGICLGMQLLFEKSYEFGTHEGLGCIQGDIVPIADAIPQGYKIPHIGWNQLHFQKESPLFRYIQDGDSVYFVHSYYGAHCHDVLATTDYGAELTAAVAKGNVYGCQFHPEKSGTVGLNILRGFCDLGDAQ